MNEGYISTVLGLKGMPKEAEEVALSRDLALCQMTESLLHVAHLSTANGVELIRKAKVSGVRVTTEVTPHHFTLTDREVRSFDTNTKVNLTGLGCLSTSPKVASSYKPLSLERGS
ncbi:unnamed protein product [marine sediment metagenome]|uniref:Amidohydrolase-related domain-containing protein n=1 Tax=marine sediment metagenome TaxID=412755 RepID=X1K9Z5_9ZZZZ